MKNDCDSFFFLLGLIGVCARGAPDLALGMLCPWCGPLPLPSSSGGFCAVSVVSGSPVPGFLPVRVLALPGSPDSDSCLAIYSCKSFSLRVPSGTCMFGDVGDSLFVSEEKKYRWD